MSSIRRIPSIQPPGRRYRTQSGLGGAPRASSGEIERRGFLRGTLSLGAVTLLTGCDISNDQSLQGALRAISRWNDLVQAWLFRIRTCWPRPIATPMSRTRRATTPSIPRSR